LDESLFLKDVKYGKGLKLRDGSFVHSYKELLLSLRGMSEYEFRMHTLTNPDFFSDWIIDNYNDKTLVSKLKNADSKSAYERILTMRIKELKKKVDSREISSSSFYSSENKINSKVFSYVWFLVYAMLFVALFMQKSYYSSQIVEREKELSSAYSLVMSLNEKNSAQINTIRSLNEKLFENDLAIKELADRNEQLFEEIKRIGLLEVIGPKHRILKEQVKVNSNNAIIEVKDLVLARFTKSGSMLPTITADSLALEIIPNSSEEIQVGDVISYFYNNKMIIHRVLEIGFDEDGWYAITKGDNVKTIDPEKVRFNMVQRVLVGILY
jgi:signal peptidase I